MDDDADEEVTRMLDDAGARVHQDPLAARSLAQRAADRTRSPALLARAAYVTGQVHALTGDLEAALAQVERARTGFDAAGLPFDAVRTQLGRMHVLNEQGRHEQAVVIGEQVLADLAAADRPGAAASGEVVVAGLAAVDPALRGWLRAALHRNLALSHAFAGRYGRALAEGRAAERAYQDNGQPVEVAAVRYGLGEQLLDLGRVQEALALLTDARAAFRAEGHTLSEARCLVDLGRAAVLTGRWSDGLAHLSEARTLLEGLEGRPEIDQLLLAAAETWLGLGLQDEALVVYREAEESLRRNGQPHHLARVLLGEGAALARAGRLADAHVALDEAGELYRAAGNLPRQAQVVLEAAEVHDRSGDRPAARQCADEAVRLLGDAGWSAPLVYARLRAADLALPDLDRAESHLRAAAAAAAELGLPPLQYRAQARLGHVRRLAGRTAEARELLRGSTAVVEHLRAALPTDALRTSFLRDAAAPYADLVALELTAGDERAAFDAAERSKSRALMDLLVDRRGRTGGGEHAAALSAELAAGYTALLGHDDEGTPPEVRARRHRALQERVAELEAALREEQLRTASGASTPVGAPLPVDELARTLPDDLTVLAYHVVDDDEVVALVLAGGEVRGTRHVTALSRVRPLLRQLDAQWQRFRAGGGLALRHRDRLCAATLRLLQDLSDELLAPLGDLPDTGRLVVVAHGPLHEVPFHALHDGEQWLLERVECSVAPSASVLAATLRTAGTAPGSAPPAGPLVLGVPDEAAAHVADEAGAVAAALPGARLHLGAAATAQVLREQAPGSAVVHVACHGLFRPESPAYSALRLGDTWLTAAELVEVDLRGALVALTACETGRSRSRGPGDEVLGLARAALGAGAAAVLVSLWLVQDDVAAGLVTRWYDLLASGRTAAGALREAQLELARTGAHPYHWAPFVLVGAPDTRLPTAPAAAVADRP